MALLYTPIITYDPIADPQGMRVNHYLIERSPGDTFIYESLPDPITGYPTPLYQPDSIIMATAGSFRAERYCYPGPRAGYTVFVGPMSALNTGGQPVAKVEGQWMSLHRGELAGAVAAMRIVLKVMEKGMSVHPLRKVIVKTDSEYLAKGITDWVYTWFSKGWIGCDKSRVCNWDLWEELLCLLDDIQGRWGVHVYFWWVPCTWNKEAKKEAQLGVRVPPPTVATTSNLSAYSNPNSFQVGIKSGFQGY